LAVFKILFVFDLFIDLLIYLRREREQEMWGRGRENLFLKIYLFILKRERVLTHKSAKGENLKQTPH